MDIPGTQRRNVEQRLGEDEPIGRDHESLRARGAHVLDVGFGLEVLRLEYGKTARRGELLYRRGALAQAAAGWPVGLGEDECDVVSCCEDRVKRARGELGSAGED
jgi:hypothetical protein